MRFELKAISQEGRIESLDFQAIDESSARQQAKERGYSVIELRRRTRILDAWRPGQRFPVVLFSQELLVLLEAGLPLVDAIQTLATKERRADLRSVLERITATLRQGLPLSTALEQQAEAFSPLYVATVRAAERTSDLAPALSRYVAYEHQLESVRKRLTNAAIYPSLLIGVGGLVSLFLMVYVVPRFSKIYEERATELPFFSKVLLSWGQLIEGHGTLVFVLLGALVAAGIQALRTPSVRAALSNALWRVPTVGERMKVYQLARFYRTTGMLVRGGMSLVAALDMAADLLHPALRSPLAAARRAISEGLPVSASMDGNGLTTAVALRMLVVGERSGNMGEMMERIAVFHDEEISRWVDWVTRLFEPLLMAAIGLVIGSIVILMYMPIFEIAGSLQ